MRAPISVIIPTLNAEGTLPKCLEGLMEGLEAGLIREVIVSDGGSTDATGAIAQGWGAEILHGAASRGGQLRRGCAAAQAEWLLVIHADTVFQAGWSHAVRRHLTTPERAGWFALAFDHSGMAAKLVAGWANLRSRLGLPYGDQALLISTTLYSELGGYPDQPLMEDVAIARRLSGKLVRLDGVARTSADKYIAQGWVKRGGRNLLTLVRYFAGVDPDKLAARYRR